MPCRRNFGRVDTSTIPDEWLQRAVARARLAASWSEDDSTKVGAVIISPANDFIVDGWNGLPRRVKVTPERMTRPTKYLFFEHAERNAIYNAARQQVAIKDCAIVVTHFPCSDCARAIIQSGITSVYYCGAISSEQWDASNKASREMFREAGVDYYLVGSNKDFTARVVLLKNDELVSSPLESNC